MRRRPGEVGLREELRASGWGRRNVEVEEPPVPGLSTPPPVLRIKDRTVVVEAVTLRRIDGSTAERQRLGELTGRVLLCGRTDGDSHRDDGLLSVSGDHDRAVVETERGALRHMD